jgi:hypothetical protein
MEATNEQMAMVRHCLKCLEGCVWMEMCDGACCKIAVQHRGSARLMLGGCSELAQPAPRCRTAFLLTNPGCDQGNKTTLPDSSDKCMRYCLALPPRCLWHHDFSFFSPLYPPRLTLGVHTAPSSASKRWPATYCHVMPILHHRLCFKSMRSMVSHSASAFSQALTSGLESEGLMNSPPSDTLPSLGVQLIEPPVTGCNQSDPWCCCGALPLLTTACCGLRWTSARAVARQSMHRKRSSSSYVRQQSKGSGMSAKRQLLMLPQRSRKSMSYRV